ncbi:hypothetical protein BKP45_20755 [Anaerobacillus alkalidiazotrophicus]|uniref:histidine kinase n=1 Tax=Anaerobacillus alkalidiazotrophicus TaxID=472963 RepID=A0A1S2LWM3_9BACI|nr:sensor histidine kinase [Anaerobacillus alkalidiazotrophicus]OIJ16928.1 hypothetical protein BKP45_20755 [Anaerobacillus alkalidiazotrophicus]
MIKKKDSKDTLILFLVMLLAVPIAGELKFHPFHDDFRVSFGTPAFFLFLLWLRKINPILSGFVTGVCVVVFRIALDWVVFNQANWESSFTLHFPVFFYYFAFASAFYISKIRHFYKQPIWIGCLGVLIEILASISEIFVRSIFSDHLFSIEMLHQIIIIAIIRSFFVLGIYTLFLLRESTMAAEQQRKRNEKMTLLISKLYAESIQLKKTMQHAEEVTRDCYNLYRQLQDISEIHSQLALKIAGQVHEIKKDNTRIFAGLSQLISYENIHEKMSVRELGHLLKTSNEKYANMLGKEINIDIDFIGKHPLYHTYTTLSILGNLVSNSIEAIQTKGEITILFAAKGPDTELKVSDNGTGIANEHQELIYQPGFTTKYDRFGNPSTGIGLSYSKDLVTSLGGTMILNSTKSGSTFTIQLPKSSLSRENQ